MGQLPDLREARRRLGLALEALCHDRWVLGYLRAGSLQPIAASEIAPYDWELDWPAILYAPVGELGQRPVGLLTVGCRRDHWYSEADVHYAGSLGVTLAPMVEALRRPLGRLNPTESEVAQLLSYGLSESEIARALKVPERRAKIIADDVARKLRIVSLEVALSFPEVPARRREMRL